MEGPAEGADGPTEGTAADIPLATVKIDVEVGTNRIPAPGEADPGSVTTGERPADHACAEFTRAVSIASGCTTRRGSSYQSENKRPPPAATAALPAQYGAASKRRKDAYRKAPKVFRGDKSTVQRYLNLLELHRPPPSKNTLLFTENETLLFALRRLKEGELVYFDDAVDTMRRAREEAGLSNITREALELKMSAMLIDLSSCAADASHFTLNDDDAGEGDKRISAQYLTPSQFKPLYVAQLHRAVCRLNKKAGTPSRTESGVIREDEEAMVGTGGEKR